MGRLLRTLDENPPILADRSRINRSSTMIGHHDVSDLQKNGRGPVRIASIVLIVGLGVLAACDGDDVVTSYEDDPNCVSAPEFGDGYFLCGPDAGSEPPAGDALARGRAFVATNCSACHAIDRDDESPLEGAPPFRDLHELYPVENLAEALAEGIVTGHSGMPQFALAPAQIEDVISYLQSLE